MDDRNDLKKAGILVDNKEDGFFFMEYSEYYLLFRDTTITYDVEDWHNAYFLKLNDDGKDQTENTFAERCAGCY